MVRYVGSLATMLALGVLFASPVAGQAMTGMWQIEFEGPPGPLQVPIEFAQEGSDLTGSATMAGAEQRVTGTYEDGDLAFDIFLNFNGNAITLSFKGEVDGNAIEGSVTFPDGGTAPFKGERQ